MSKINIEYWKWNPNFSDSKYYLGQSLKEVESNFETVKLDNSDDDWLKSVNVNLELRIREGVVDFIITDEAYFNLPQTIWNLELHSFEKEMNKVLERASEDSKGDLVRIVFRDNFVTQIGIIRK